MNYIFKTITMTMILALIPFMGISAKKKVQKQSDREYWCFGLPNGTTSIGKHG